MKIKGSLLGDVDIVFFRGFSCSTGYNLKKTIYVESRCVEDDARVNFSSDCTDASTMERISGCRLKVLERSNDCCFSLADLCCSQNKHKTNETR
jgi:hypothetical protein